MLFGVDYDGNLWVGGTLDDQVADLSSPPAGSFVVKNSAGTNKLYVDPSGNLKMAGTLYTAQSSISSGTGSLLVRRKTDLANVMKIDTSGNLFIKGLFGGGADDGAPCSNHGDCCSGYCYSDNDGDGYYAEGGTCQPSQPANTGDCCDNDANAYPGQTSYFSSTNACGSWDYDCSGSTNYGSSCTTYYCTSTPSVSYSGACTDQYGCPAYNSATISCSNSRIGYNCGNSMTRKRVILHIRSRTTCVMGSGGHIYAEPGTESLGCYWGGAHSSYSDSSITCSCK